MGEQLRDNWMIVLFQSALTIILLIAGFWYQTNRLNAQGINDAIDKKADKTELEKLETDNDREHAQFIRSKEWNMLIDIVTKYENRQIVIEKDVKRILEIMPKN